MPGAIITTTVWACKIYGGSVLSFPFPNTGAAIIKPAATNIENRPRIPPSFGSAQILPREHRTKMIDSATRLPRKPGPTEHS